jgi:hypothetical protein
LPRGPATLTCASVRECPPRLGKSEPRDGGVPQLIEGGRRREIEDPGECRAKFIGVARVTLDFGDHSPVHRVEVNPPSVAVIPLVDPVLHVLPFEVRNRAVKRLEDEERLVGCDEDRTALGHAASMPRR